MCGQLELLLSSDVILGPVEVHPFLHIGFVAGPLICKTYTKTDIQVDPHQNER